MRKLDPATGSALWVTGLPAAIMTSPTLDGAGAIAPMAYGFLGDAIGLERAIAVVACVVLLVLPLTLLLRPAVARIER